MADVGTAALALALLSVATGAVVQGSVGFGFALVAVPTFGLLRPEAIPVVVLFLAVPMTLSMAVRERGSIDRVGFLWILVGRLPGTAAGVWVLTVVPRDAFSVMVGGFILAAVVLSIIGPAIALRGRTRLVAGATSGMMGTAVGIGGPPLALLYQHRPGPELRSTLAVSFFSGLLISIAALAAVQKVEAWHFALALKLLPALILGLWASARLARFLDERWLRPAVLTFAAVAGLVAIVQGLVD